MTKLVSGRHLIEVIHRPASEACIGGASTVLT
jgi:hypothetical protein